MKPKSNSPLLMVYDREQVCIGFLLSHGPMGWGAYGQDNEQIGDIWPTREEAVLAVYAAYDPEWRP
jgi:hypothetical protein